MIRFLTGQPLWIAALIVVVFGTAISMIGPAVIRRFVTLDKLTSHNEIAGFKFTALTTLYAILLAFVIFVVWERFSAVQTSVVNEASAAETVYRLSPALGDTAAAELRQALSNYIKAAVADDWPAMAQSDIDGAPSARLALDGIYTALLRIVTSQPGGNQVVSEILHQIDEISRARRARLIASKGTVPDVIWYVLFGGGATAIGFTFFFGTKNLRAQTVMTGLIALLITSELLTVIAIDQPFTGGVSVSPAALTAVLADFGAGGQSGTAAPADPHPH
jgi:hypothetical protein